jgi:glycosyltransferase involved in cell wall biosynthesis
MKVMFSHSLPFHLAHGGLQVQIEEIGRELHALGVEVEMERWWDPIQRAEVLQYFGRPPGDVHVRLAHRKGLKVVMFENLDQTASRPRRALWGQRMITRLAARLLPGLTNRMGWQVYRQLDAMIYATELEWSVAQYLFDAPVQRGHVIGHGLREESLADLRRPEPPGDHLVSIATITERKNSVLLARAARHARVPVVFLGKPYAETDPYFRQFQSLVDNRWVRYPGFVSEEEKRRLIRSARGFALLSRFESGCIAVYEAAAAGLPLFLSDLPWAKRVYGNVPRAKFTDLRDETALAAALAGFYHGARRSEEPTFPVGTWRDVARRYLAVYEQVLSK